MKLEGNKTMIYVNGKLFLQCKYLLLNRRSDEIQELILNSVDEMEDFLDNSLEPVQLDDPESDHDIVFELSPEVEFWGHCSNIQAWYEFNYDSRLLHRNLAFPLLKKLTKEGDPLAKNVFKNEIAKRIDIGNKNVIKYLIIEHYLVNFPNE